MQGTMVWRGSRPDLMVPKEGITRKHRRDEPLFVLSMVA